MFEARYIVRSVCCSKFYKPSHCHLPDPMRPSLYESRGRKERFQRFQFQLPDEYQIRKEGCLLTDDKHRPRNAFSIGSDTKLASGKNTQCKPDVQERNSPFGAVRNRCQSRNWKAFREGKEGKAAIGSHRNEATQTAVKNAEAKTVARGSDIGEDLFANDISQNWESFFLYRRQQSDQHGFCI